jgi:hypothetical protein
MSALFNVTLKCKTGFLPGFFMRFYNRTIFLLGPVDTK